MLKVLKKVGAIAYKLKLPQELSRVHNTFHVSNLKKCYSDDPLVVPLGGLQVDDKLHSIEEPVEIMDREVKQLRQSRVPIVKVSAYDELKDILHPYQKLKGFYKEVLNWGSGYIKNEKVKEWLTRGHVSIHEME
ncbi:hypothetical protein Tco_0990659 [Tanacetum coccineum]|uniref:Tf2-1-like SH3-like domain-containing protein n=1 Tax=Tanacetum coccineum TaxID=301880 RepID=A0ABQ5EY84_9ASTR